MYADDDRPDLITKDGVMTLLRTCFTVAMSHYSGQSKVCPLVGHKHYQIYIKNKFIYC